nr:hypothetical protein [Cytophagales bacterium]
MRKIILSIAFFMSTFVAYVPKVNANILITPTRVVFEERDRFQSLTLVNNSGKTRTYNIEWVFFKMLDGTNGSYEELDAPFSDFNLSKHVVFSPRRVTLAPGASQKVRLALRRPPEIAPGDYHAHLKFFLDANAPEDIIVREQENQQKRGTSAAVSINVSYSIPVFLTVGQPDVQAKMGDLKLERNEESGNLHAKFSVERLGGPYTLHGYAEVFHVAPDGTQTLVGELTNGHIFPEATSRSYDVAIPNDFPSSGNLRVILRHYDKSKDLIYAERTFPLQ